MGKQTIKHGLILMILMIISSDPNFDSARAQHDAKVQ